MQKYFVQNATIINQNEEYIGSILIENGKIQKILRGENSAVKFSDYEIIDAEDLILFPGIIDVHTHFREPGLTDKADIYTESKAAIAGGITSYFEMPNTVPQTTTIGLLEQKNKIAKEKSLANYSFFLGATNDNYDEIKKLDSINNCGLKLFLGASTGDMHVDNEEAIENIFKNCKFPIVVHSEDSNIISKNLEIYKKEYGNKIPMQFHNSIRSTEACYKTTNYAVSLAKKHNTKLHIAHITTAKELELLDNKTSVKQKRITAEVCPQHLMFDESDYKIYGTQIKCNPSIKTKDDKEKLFEALIDNNIDIISSDHAPHLLEEKKKHYTKAPSGIPIIQFSLVSILESFHQNKITLNKIVEKMCHNPAIIFNIEKRGFIQEGFWADFVLIDIDRKWIPLKNEIISKCKWSPFTKNYFRSKVTHTFVNGNMVFENGEFNETIKGQKIKFKRN